ncbi:MAG: hypothetical protein K2P81_05625 [Bacteriovoracaceae bacterium]|nr:hypothetical protein [Bacteriovoracaceae bacterium]
MKFLILTLFLSCSAFAQSYGTYHVPVPAELNQFASFEVIDANIQIVNDKINVSYRLPTELVGPIENTVTLSGTIKQRKILKLRGPNSRATCVNTETQLECKVTYPDLIIDNASVEEYLKQTIQDPAELKARLEVATTFSTEPVGIVTLNKF